jgi:hypothetical protein
VIRDPEKEYLLNNLQPMKLPSSPPSVEQGNNSEMEDNFISLDQDRYITAASNVESSSKDEFHI